MTVSAIHPAFLADPDLNAVLDALPAARLVGGCVRDAMANRPVADIDLAVPLSPDQIMAALQRAGLRFVPTGLAHGTVTALSGGKTFEVTSLRQDVAADGRHAHVAWTDSWRIDAARRDFTFNAMSMTRDGLVSDPFGGLDDLRAGRVRFVGDAARRIEEDYLRLLRFFRFHARYGQGAPDSAALAAIACAVPGLARLSPERVWSEMRRILAAPDPAGAVALMARLGVLAALFPDGASPAALGRLTAAGAPADPLLRLAALLDGDAACLAARWRLSNTERDRLAALRASPAPDPAWPDAALRRMLADTDLEILVGRGWLRFGVDMHPRLESLMPPSFPLAGRDVLALGVPPGPAVGRLLHATRAWWLAGGCVADAAACRAELAALAARGCR